MQQYSFGQTVLLINGVTVSGFDEGDDVITLRRLTDNSAHIMSADGVMTVSFHPDRSGECIFRLNQASDFNGFMSALVSAQEANTLVPIAIQFTDLNGNDIISATTGYIPRPADIIRGLNSQSQEWRIIVEKLVMIHKGLGIAP